MSRPKKVIEPVVEDSYPDFINIKSTFYCKELDRMIMRGNYKPTSKKDYEIVVKCIK